MSISHEQKLQSSSRHGMPPEEGAQAAQHSRLRGSATPCTRYLLVTNGHQLDNEHRSLYQMRTDPCRSGLHRSFCALRARRVPCLFTWRFEDAGKDDETRDDQQ